MLDKMIELCEAFERERSNSKRWAFTIVFDSLYSKLSDEEQEYIDKTYSHLRFYDKDFHFEDSLMNNYDVHLEMFKRLKDRYEDSNFNFYSLTANEKISQNELVEICDAIIDDFGLEDLRKLFNDLMKKKNINVGEIGYGLGICFNNFALGDSYIVLNNRIVNDVSAISTLMHEVGHAYENRFMLSMNYQQQIFRYNDIFSEVMSSFFARVSLDYCIKNHIYLDDSQRVLNEKYVDTLACFDELNFVIRNILRDKIGYDFAGEYYSLVDEVTSDDEIFLYSDFSSLSCDYSNCLKYGYGGLIAEYFFDIYRQDKKEGLKMIKNFLSNQTLLNDRKMFDSIGLLGNDLSFLNKGISENREYMKKRYKW